jgi:hypothetical protein
MNGTLLHVDLFHHVYQYFLSRKSTRKDVEIIVNAISVQG